jgi:hypothetical protein
MSTRAVILTVIGATVAVLAGVAVVAMIVT